MSVMSTAERTDSESVGIDDAVELVWSRVMGGEFENVALAVRSLWPSLVFSEDSFDYLAVYGLVALCQHEQRNTRTAPEPRPAIGWGAPHGKRWTGYVALTWPYERADGSAAPLAEFTAEDLVAFAARCENLARAYRRRRQWAGHAAAALREHGCERVRDLPAGVLSELEAEALEAIGRQA